MCGARREERSEEVGPCKQAESRQMDSWTDKLKLVDSPSSLPPSGLAILPMRLLSKTLCRWITWRLVLAKRTLWRAHILGSPPYSHCENVILLNVCYLVLKFPFKIDVPESVCACVYCLRIYLIFFVFLSLFFCLFLLLVILNVVISSLFYCTLYLKALK